MFCQFLLPNASRHNSVFDISTSKSAPTLRCWVHFYFKMCFEPQWRANVHFSSAQCLRTRRFSEPTFQPSGATKHWKNIMFGDFPTFSFAFLHISFSPFWLSPRPSFFLALLLPGCAFHLSILSEVELPNFLRWGSNFQAIQLSYYLLFGYPLRFGNYNSWDSAKKAIYNWIYFVEIQPMFGLPGRIFTKN